MYFHDILRLILCLIKVVYINRTPSMVTKVKLLSSGLNIALYLSKFMILFTFLKTSLVILLRFCKRFLRMEHL